MKRTILVIALLFFLIKPAFSQEDQFNALSPSQVDQFVQPFATSLGEGLNTGGFHTAHVSKLFGFSVSFKGMYILIPNSQKTFTPSLPQGYTSDKPTATFWGDKGAVYSGPNGYITYPNGINQASIPFVFPQVTASFMGTEVLVRYVPKLKVGGRDLDFFGFGIRHSISQYIPLIPVDVAVQFLYNKLTVSNLIDASSIAINGEVSKTFGPLTAYGGLQYESSKFDLSYNVKADPNSGDPFVRQGGSVSASVNGKGNFRMILGASVKLAVVALSVDYNISSQSVISGGISFEF